MSGFEREPGCSLAENVDQTIEAAFAALSLVDEGRLALDEPIADGLPAFRPRLADGREACIAPRQLLSHSAGLGYCADACRLAPFEDSVGIRFEPGRAFEPSAYASGGAGMIGSAGDVLRLLEILRQGGAPLLTPGLVEEMGRDQVPGMELPANPGFGFGLGFSVLRDAVYRSAELR